MDNYQKNKYRFSSTKPLLLVSDEIIKSRSNQVNSFVSDLLKYKVLVRDLIKNNLSYSIRNELLNIAMFIVSNYELYDEFVKKQDIPNILHIKTRVDKKFIERYRDYIIAYTLIFGNPTYRNIEEYIQVEEVSEDESSNDIIEYEENLSVTGIVIGNTKRNAIVITSLGEFKKVKLNEYVDKGDEVKGKEKKTLKDYILYVSIISIFSVILTLSIVYKYNSVVSTVIVETTSNIKLDINGFNRVLNASATTERGKLLLEESNILDKNIDKAICKVIEYANENDMIKSGGIVVTITGKALKYNALTETEDYIYKKDLKVRFNNSGLEHKLN